MKISTFLLVFLLFGASLSAQHVWDGGGDGTSWNDAANWERDVLPKTDSVVIFRSDVTVTGTAGSVIPVQVKINGKANVTLDLDLEVGNGQTAEHAFTMADTTSLTFGNGTDARRIVANTAGNKHGIVIGGGVDGATVTVAEAATFEVESGVSGINLANGTSRVINNGTMLILTGVKDGFRVAGTFTNNGTITGTQVGRDLFNVKNDGVLLNTATGRIVSDQAGDDGIDLVTGASFVNDGSLRITTTLDGGSGNSAINVGDDESAASFVNNGTDVVLNGNDSVSVRTLAVDTLGSLVNNGTLTISGGNTGSSLYVRGNAVNGLNATLDLTDGRFNVQEGGAFVNDGLVKTTREGTGGFVNGTATNNAFFDYATSNSFAGGSNGTVVDKGFSLNNNDTRVNARNACTADLANAPYEWFLNGASYATASDTGALAFAPMSVIADSVVLTTTLAGVEITVVNICAEAVEASGVFAPRVSAETMRAFPNPLAAGRELTLDLSGLPLGPVRVRVVNAFGQVTANLTLAGGGAARLATRGWVPGTYVVSALRGERLFTGRVVITD